MLSPRRSVISQGCRWSAQVPSFEEKWTPSRTEASVHQGSIAEGHAWIALLLPVQEDGAR
jgi:hypothetical protein